MPHYDPGGLGITGPNYTKLWSSLPRICAELFAGSAHLTEEFAAKGYNVFEPRDILLGHNLFDPLQQETVFNDINYKKPKLLWVALPCTKWSQWQRLNYARRRQALRRARAEQRRLIHFAVECAWNQIANGNEEMTRIASTDPKITPRPAVGQSLKATRTCPVAYGPRRAPIMLLTKPGKH